eukprot:Protomagalhaensia_sp_Gyna_25__3245@NODE_2950_length_805_cov_87_027415_g2465_i0_p1_GENE_NODE_2950_length_805_cov_87_027415_g2465_i0NODE_2950_length_805_cov_87_027415_g2465_i0_p1_ORF_typecomplete_len178_score38_11RRS1/PF04939_12/3_6e30_NODE_2950_length_805_cov_87_027415_g2465_i0168701
MSGLVICYHHLIAESPDAISADIIKDKKRFDELITERLQNFVHSIYKELPRETTEDGTFGLLEPLYMRKFQLPRTRRVPTRDVLMTKWEEFAKKKGIRKTKKQSLVFDAVDKNWKLNRGGRSLKHAEEQREWLIEHKSSENPYIDPFQLRNEMKKAKRGKQQIQEFHNKVRKSGYKL